MSSFFYEGGWGMYPTSLFGFFLVGSSVLYLLRPRRKLLNVALSLGFVTLGSGLLGFITGVGNTFRYLQNVPAADQIKIAALGCAESLNNLALSLMLLILTGLLVSVGLLRAPRAEADSARASTEAKLGAE